jgi:hypothetical protein
MIDLDHLDALDDSAPPPADLDDVRARAGRMRARHRSAAVGASAAVLLVAVVLVVAARGDDPGLRVGGPTATTPTVKPTARGVLPNDVSIDLTLETPAVVLGSDIRATVVAHNETSETKTLGVDPIQCALGVGPVLYDPQGRAIVEALPAGCYDVGVALEPGASRSFDVRVPTNGVASEGRYFLTLQAPGEPPWALDNVPVTITQPALRARLEIGRTSYAAGSLVDGTIVFDNPGPALEYDLDCYGSPPWDVMLATPGRTLEGRTAPTECFGRPGTTAQLPAGETRIPFFVLVSDPLERAALEPGHYLLLFRGHDAPFGPLRVEVLGMDVTAGTVGELPRITATDAAGAREGFDALYRGMDASYRAPLYVTGVRVVDTYVDDDKLVIEVPPSDLTPRMRMILLPLFEHPEIVTVREALIQPK